jgi:hypothetical protein
MIKLKVLKDYNDMKMNKKVRAGEIIEVSNKRGLDLLEKARLNNLLGFAIIKIDKLSKNKNAEATSSKKR